MLLQRLLRWLCDIGGSSPVFGKITKSFAASLGGARGSMRGGLDKPVLFHRVALFGLPHGQVKRTQAVAVSTTAARPASEESLDSTM